MSWFIRLLALTLTIGLTLPLLAQDAKKADAAQKDEKKGDEKKPDGKTDDKKDMKKDDEKEKLLPAGTVQGKIMNLNEDKRTMKVELTTYIPKLDEGEAKAFVDAQNAYQRAMATQRDPRKRAEEMANAQRDMAMHHAKLYKQEKKTQQVELSIMDDAKIRVAAPPIAFDDDGKAKRYTTKELAELKGDPKLPGFTAEFSALATGEMVQITLVRKKDAKPIVPVKPMVGGAGLGGIPKPKDVGAGEDALTDNLPLATMIVIVQQGDK